MSRVAPPALEAPRRIHQHDGPGGMASTAPPDAPARPGPQARAPLSKSHDHTRPTLHHASAGPGAGEKATRPAPLAASVEADDDDADDFPEGGLRAWSVVLGCFCGSFAVFGLINATAVFQEYWSTHQLAASSASRIAWIFSLSLFLTFFCGVLIGPVLDARGPRPLVLGGSVLLGASMMLLGLCTEYWHFILVYSILNGLGGSLMVTPSFATIGHFFLRKRGTATGIATTAGSLGGIVFPLLLQRLLPALGFARATRVLGLILIGLLVLANLLIRARLPRRKLDAWSAVLPDLAILLDPKLAALTLGIFLLEWGLFIPLAYVTSYAVARGQSAAFGFQILAILNAGSFVGRVVAGYVADYLGRLNTLILTVSLCVITTLGLWLPASRMNSNALLITYALTFGCASGSNLSLSPVCVGQLCRTENYGRYYATCWMVVSFGTLTGLPIAGAILAATSTNYEYIIIFCGLSYAGALICFVTSRILAVGYKLREIY